MASSQENERRGIYINSVVLFYEPSPFITNKLPKPSSLIHITERLYQENNRRTNVKHKSTMKFATILPFFAALLLSVQAQNGASWYDSNRNSTCTGNGDGHISCEPGHKYNAPEVRELAMYPF